jgi:hypothetical protein
MDYISILAAIGGALTGLILVIYTKNNFFVVTPSRQCDLGCGKNAMTIMLALRGHVNFCNDCKNSICLDCFKKYKERWFTTQRLKTFGCPWCEHPIRSDHPVYDLCTKEEKERWDATDVITEEAPVTKTTLRTRLSEFRIRLTTTKCPGCHMRVKKLDGCNHITCVCGTDFCYRCGQQAEYYDDHSCRKLGLNRLRP